MRTLSFFIFFSFAFNLFSQINENIDLIYEYDRGEPRYSGSWFFVDQNGTEYALIGAYSGTAIYKLDQDEATELAFIPGPASNWREITVINNHAYVVTEGLGEGEGMQVIDLSNLPNEATLVNTLDNYFQKAHIIQKNIFEDTPYIYVCGTNTTSGVHIFDCTIPESPEEVGIFWEGYYIHDVHIRDTLMFAAAIYDDIVEIISIADPSNPVAISGFDDPGTYTHSFSTSPDMKYLFVADEKDGYPMRTYNIEDIYDPEEINTYTANIQSLVHNPYTNGIFTIVSHNTEGLRILDTRDPELILEVGYYDTYEGESGGYSGLWSACPYLPSGRIIGADRNRGLMVWEFNNTEAARIYGTIVDSETQTIIENASLSILEPDTTLTETGQFKWVNAGGTYTVSIEAEGFEGIESELVMTPGDSSTVVFELSALVSTKSPVVDKIKIYPNPSNSNHVKIKTNSDCKILEVFSLDGKKIIQKTIETETNIDLTLKKGSYQICLKDNRMNVIYLEKVIIQF